MLSRSILLSFPPGLLLVLTVLANGVASESEKDKLVTAGDAAPKVMTFDSFKQTFHKTYGSIIEEASRKVVYMGRVFLAYMTSISYRHNKTSSFLAINQMSDWTDEEFEKTLINVDKLRQRELARGDGKLPLELLDLPDQQVGDDTIRGYYYDDNSQLRSVEMRASHRRSNSPVRRRKRDLFGRFSKDKEVEVFHDYRTWKPSPSSNTSCLQPVRDQGDCGSCYIFATMALYEWMHCATTGRAQAFSEQFVLDCGDHGGDDGCDGGFPSKVGKFVGDFGVQFLSNYPYESFSYSCPSEDKGRLALGHFARPQLVKVSNTSYEAMLDIGPVQVDVFLPRFFMIYGGGVDSGRVCGKKSDLHAMLLVGDGRADGREYWLFRNSYSRSWGERGYYRISKKSRCLYRHGLVPVDYFEPAKYENLFEFRENLRYNSTFIEGLDEERASGRTLGARISRKLNGLLG